VVFEERKKACRQTGPARPRRLSSRFQRICQVTMLRHRMFRFVGYSNRENDLGSDGIKSQPVGQRSHEAAGGDEF
jgi:hypothetical protein